MDFSFAFAPFAPEPEHRYFSLGAACGVLQVTPGQVRVLMEAADVKFARMVDGVPYLDGHGLMALEDKAREVRDEIQGKLEAVPCN